MSSMEYQHPMQLMELLGLRDWENAQPRVYWGLRRPDELDPRWMAPNAGLGGGAGWGGSQGGYGMVTGGGGGFNSAGVFSNPGAASFSAAPSAARSFGSDVGGAGATEPGGFSGAGVGMNAESPTFGDWIGSFTTPVTAWGSLLGQAAYNGIMGRPAQPINNLSLQSLLFGNSAGDGNTGGAYGGDLGGGATSAATGNYGGAALDFASATPGFGGGYSSAGDGSGGGGVNTDPGGVDAGAGRGSEWYMGGPVTKDRLIGPNPPGPDDGYGSLKHGEHVLTAEEVEAAGGHEPIMQLREMLRRRR